MMPAHKLPMEHLGECCSIRRLEDIRGFRVKNARVMLLCTECMRKDASEICAAWSDENDRRLTELVLELCSKPRSFEPPSNREFLGELLEAISRPSDMGGKLKRWYEIKKTNSTLDAEISLGGEGEVFDMSSLEDVEGLERTVFDQENEESLDDSQNWAQMPHQCEEDTWPYDKNLDSLI